MGREPCTLPITSRRLCTRPGSYAAELIRGQACTRLGSHANEIITGQVCTLPGSYAPGLVRGRLCMVRGFAWYVAELVCGWATGNVTEGVSQLKAVGLAAAKFAPSPFHSIGRG